MKRISVYIRDDQLNNLEQLGNSKKKPYAELIREAIDYKLLTEFGGSPIGETIKNSFGILKDRFDENMESSEIINNLRTEWENRIERNKKK